MAACTYNIGGKSYNEQEFKEYLLNGGMEELLSEGAVDIEGLHETFNVNKPSKEPDTNKANPPQPPKPPVPPQQPEGGKFENKPKAILNTIYDSQNVSESFKQKFRDDPKQLKYKPQTHEEARKLAKEIVGEFGTENAVAMAESGRFHGDVNSMIFAESIDQTFALEQSAKTQEEKIKHAEQWADYAIRYDESARDKGRFISAIYNFYRKSPLGVILADKARKSDAFREWYRKREKNFKELFNEIKDDPEFREYFEKEIEKRMKSERKEHRESRRQKINDIFDSGKIKGDNLSSSIIPPQIWNAAVEVMKQAALAGESILSIVEAGVQFIKDNHTDAWDENAFRAEWADKLKGMDRRTVKTDDEKIKNKAARLLDRFRDKLGRLSEEQQHDVIRRSFKTLAENGALEYEDFKKIVADVMGLGELSAEEVTKLTGFVKDINAVQDVSDKVIEAKTDQEIKDSIREFDKVSKKAQDSANRLYSLLYNKADIGQRIRSIIQLNTLGVVSLIKNPFYNIFHQIFVRFPKGIVMTLMDQAIYGASLLGNKLFGNPVIRPDVNIFIAQHGYFKKFGEGGAQSLEQLFTGLTNKDYFQKEIHTSQIKPFKALRDLRSYYKKELHLSTEQLIDKYLQVFPGIPAEAVARMLNIGDKPFRFAAEGAIAETIGRQEFKLGGIQMERFIRFPKEIAKSIYMERGIPEEEATKKAEQIEERIIKEGEEAVFQQSNIVSEVFEGIKNKLQSKEDASPTEKFGKNAARLFGVLNMPFVKTPVNIAWEVLNLVVPELAMAQSIAYGISAVKNNSHNDFLKSKKWLAHATTGYALMSLTSYLASNGAISGDDEDEQYKAKEAKGKSTYQKTSRLNISKVFRLITGGTPSDEDGDMLVDLSWFGATGVIMNMQANRYENMTKEERESQGYVSNLFSRIHQGIALGLMNSVFEGTINGLDAIRTGRTDNWFTNMMNVGLNFAEPATFAQLSRASRPYEYSMTADDFSGKMVNNLRARFFGKVTPKTNIWGEPMKREGGFKDVTLRMAGFSRYDKNVFAEPIHQDFKRTGNADFYPPAVSKKITINKNEKELTTKQYQLLDAYVGSARKALVGAFVNDKGKTGDSIYSKLNDDQKIKVLKELYKKGYDYGKAQFLYSNPDLLQNK